MPQMKPSPWMLIMIMVTTLSMITMIIEHFHHTPKPKSSQKQLFSPKTQTKWK